MVKAACLESRRRDACLTPRFELDVLYYRLEKFKQKGHKQNTVHTSSIRFFNCLYIFF